MAHSLLEQSSNEINYRCEVSARIWRWLLLMGPVIVEPFWLVNVDAPRSPWVMEEIQDGVAEGRLRQHSATPHPIGRGTGTGNSGANCLVRRSSGRARSAGISRASSNAGDAIRVQASERHCGRCIIVATHSVASILREKLTDKMTSTPQFDWVTAELTQLTPARAAAGFHALRQRASFASMANGRLCSVQLRASEMRISVFGIGYVGVVSSVCLTGLGHQVICVDVARAKVDMVKRGRSPIVEASVDELISKSVAQGHITATQDGVAAVAASDLSLICVGTPAPMTAAFRSTPWMR